MLSATACDLVNPADSEEYEPSRLPVGELTMGVWLPAGLEQFRFDEADQRLLEDLGVNQIEWLQRAEIGESTAEQVAMEFCNRAGLRMPVYYEPAGYSPYDKLHNWATRTEVDAGFDDDLRERVVSLKTQWSAAVAFSGYLIGHEDYSKKYYDALARTVEVLRQEDPLRPAITVGNIESYPSVNGFLDAFFIEADGAANVFQHEHYVFRAETPSSGPALKRQLDDLVDGYGRVARRVQDRNGRWHAIVQVHGETREGLGLSGPYYRKPSAGEIRVQVGLALARGAAGIIYFLYSSGTEEVRDGDDSVIQERLYEGLADDGGAATPAYEAVKGINQELVLLSRALEALHFHGGYRSDRLPHNELIRDADEDLDIGFFGSATSPTHILVVNRRTDIAREVQLQIHGDHAVEAVVADELTIRDGAISLDLEAGGFRLLEVRRSTTEDGE